MASEPKPDEAAFKAAVAREVDERMAKFRDEMLAAMQPKSQGLEILGPVMEQLSMRISAAADQSNGGRGVGIYVDPEILARREASRARMVDLIVDIRNRGVMPLYRVKYKTVLDHSMIEPFWLDPATKAAKETEIEFDGIPNEAMVPLDDDAKRIYEAYKGWIGDFKKAVPEDRLGITSSGVVVRGNAVQGRREVRSAEDGAQAQVSRRPEVRISRMERAVGAQKRILGSIHPPVIVVGG